MIPSKLWDKGRDEVESHLPTLDSLFDFVFLLAGESGAGGHIRRSFVKAKSESKTNGAGWNRTIYGIYLNCNLGGKTLQYCRNKTYKQAETNSDLHIMPPAGLPKRIIKVTQGHANIQREKGT